MTVSLPVAVLVVAAYTLAAYGFGSRLQRWLFGRGPVETPCEWTWAASAFLLGQGALANLWLLISLTGTFWGSVVGSIVAVGAVVAGFELRRSLRPLARELSDVGRDWLSESILWKLVALGVVALLVGMFLQVAAQPLPPGDAEAYYMAQPKAIAAEGRFLPLPGYEILAIMGLVGEMHWSALMTLGLEEHVRIFAWPAALAAAILLGGMARRAVLGRRAQWLLVAIPFTSLGFTQYVWDGKTDTFGTALGIAAYFWAFRPISWGSLRLMGAFAGIAVMAKASLIVPLGPGLLIALVWNDALRESKPATWSSRLLGIAVRCLIVTAVALAAAAPQMLKNAVVFGEPLAPFVSLSGPNQVTEQNWFGPEATRYIVLTYPFSLVYGKYPMMGGGVSPLVLMFLPLVLLLPRPASWSRSRLLQMSLIGLVGVVAWVIVRPSVLAPRYIFPPLMLLGLPAVAAVEAISRPAARSRALALLCIGGILMVQFVSLRYWIKIDRLLVHAERLYRPSVPEPKHPTREACEAVNAKARPEERVLMACFYRYWLRPDLLRLVDRRDEIYVPDPNRYWKKLEKEPNAIARWNRVRDGGFRFVVVDGQSHDRFYDLFAIDRATGRARELPSEMQVKCIYRRDKVSAYQIKIRAADDFADPHAGRDGKAGEPNQFGLTRLERSGKSSADNRYPKARPVMPAAIKSSPECPDVSTYLSLLRTPGGKNDLLIRSSGLQSRDGGDAYPIVDGIPVLSPVEHHKVVATDVQEYYDKEAVVYNNSHGSALQGTQYNIDKHYGRLFEKYVRGADNVLEFGAGTGRFTKVFKPMVRSLIATDFSMPMLLKARGLGVPLVCADTQALPFASNTFDLLVGITTFSYVPNKAKAMAEFHRVLKPNGRLLMLDQNFGGFVMYLVSGYYFQSRKKTRPTEVRESTIANYKRLFQENKFTIDQTEVFSWVPHTVQAVGTKLYGVIDSVFSHVPVLRGQAMRLFITGRVQK